MPFSCNQGHKNQPGSQFCTHCGEPLWLPVGHILEKRYRIVKQISAGGFGRTYLAEDIHRFNERCVLKEFAPQVQGANHLQKAKELFEREAAALYQLKHPQMPGFREFFQGDLGGGVCCLFLAQDYVEGQTYCDLLKSSKRLSEADVINFMCQLLPVLNYIHSQGVIHRDISPDNLILRHSDKMPVLIDLGGVKQVAATAVSKFTHLNKVATRLGKQGYAPEEQIRQGQAYPSSDLYALAVTVLVLLTGKEPQELYDSYKGTWLWRREIKVTSQLETVLQKMLAYKPGDRYQSAKEVMQALQSITTTPQPDFNISNIPTVNVVGQKPDNNFSYNNNQGGTQVISVPQFDFSWLRRWLIRAGSTGLVILIGIGTVPLIKLMINLVPSVPAQNPAPSNSPISDKTRTKQLLSRRQTLGIKDGFFINVVDESFHTKYPELQGRSLKPHPDDAQLRSDWYNIAEQLLDKLEQAQLSPEVRHKLGSYTQQDYKIWQQQANQEPLTEQTNQKFYQLFPQQQGKKLNQKTFGQIWYAIAAEQVSKLQTQ